jgi:hypothetical protein
MACPVQPGDYPVALLPYGPGRLLGAGLQLSDGAGGLGVIEAAKAAGSVDLDLDGDTTGESVSVASMLNITCQSGGATPTPTPPGLVGDVNCDGLRTAVDAALILQLNAGLIEALTCEEHGDTNEDGDVNAVDAALVLQFVAGLIDSLPP